MATMKVLQYIYNSKIIDFSVENQNVMINATQMAQVFGKLPKDFLRNEDTKRFISACIKRGEKLQNLEIKKENSPFSNITTEMDLVHTKQKSGTWMHRVLALKFAAWLDPDFEVWIFETIDKLILGHFKELKEATQEKIIAQQKLAQKRQELLEKHPDDFAEFLQIEKQLNQADKRRLKALKQSTEQLQLNFF